MKLNTMPHLSRFIPLAIALCLTSAAFIAEAQSISKSPVRYRFCVVPQYSATEIYRDWAPLLRRVEQETGIALELKVASSIPKFENLFLKGSPDFAYLNPYHVVMAREAQGYIPLWRDSKPLSGILMVQQGSSLKSATELAGQTIVFPSPNAFGASLYMRALLIESLGVKFTAKYVGTHSNVFRHVIRQEAAAGGSVQTALEGEANELKAQLRVIYKTPEVASHPVAVHPRVPEAVRKALTQAFFNLTQDEAGRALLQGINMPNPVTASYERDYLPLEKLNLQKYLVAEKEKEQ